MAWTVTVSDTLITFNDGTDEYAYDPGVVTIGTAEGDVTVFVFGRLVHRIGYAEFNSPSGADAATVASLIMGSINAAYPASEQVDNIYAPFVMELSTTGDISTTLAEVNMAQDFTGGGVGSIEFYCQPTGKVYLVKDISIYLKDGGTWTADKFGDLPALSNGIDITYTYATGSKSLSPMVIKSNGDILKYNKHSLVGPFSSGDNLIHAHFDLSLFSPFGGLFCSSLLGTKIGVTLTDDLAALSALRIVLKGDITTEKLGVGEY